MVSCIAADGNTSKQMSIIVVGAGIGGLTAGLELQRRGYNVKILERTASESQLGDTISIGPSAMDLFGKHHPELFEDLQTVVYDPQIYYYKYTGEKILGPTRWAYTRPGEREARGLPRFSRPQLHQVLLKHVEKLGIPLIWGKSVVSYEEDLETKRASVVCKDGSTYGGDLVVAADGVKTNSWKLIGDEQPAARPSGNSIFRTAFPVGLVKDLAVVEHFRLDVEQPYFSVIEGGGVYGGIGRTKSELTWAIFHPDSPTSEESWGNRVDPEEAAKLLEAIPGFDPMFIRAVRATPKDQLIDWKLMFRDPQPQWASPGGLVIQLGDSAHSFLPTSGNGGTQAIEDAFSLGACLDKAGKNNIQDATAVHCKLRFERVTCIQLYGFYNQFSRNNPNWDAIKETPESIKIPFPQWIWNHDPERYAEQHFDAALKHLQDGVEFKNTNTPAGYTYKRWTLDDMMKIAAEKGQIKLEGEWLT